MPANYDPVAGFYDPLSRLVFGNAIVRSQVFLLSSIPAKAKVLVVGGGTGWILKEMRKIHPGGLRITYVESSGRMIQKSKKYNTGENQVIFIQAPIQEAVLEGVFDVVLTPFLLDNFTDDALKLVFAKLDRHLKKGGLWLFADFQVHENKPSSEILLKIMYFFFGIFCGLETSKLPDSAALFQQFKYQEKSRKEFFRGLISSVIWQKKQPLSRKTPE